MTGRRARPRRAATARRGRACRSRRACRARGSARRRATAGQRADRADDRAPRSAPVDVIDAGGERRGVEAVVDRRDEVLLDAAGVLGRRAPRRGSCRGSWRRRPRSACGATGSSPWRSRYSAESSVGTTAHSAHRVGAGSSARRRCRARPEAARAPNCETAVRSAVERDGRAAAAAIAGSTSATASGMRRAAARSRRRTRRAAPWRRQLALEHQVPDVLERALLGEVDRGVLAVVVEALEAAHVADGRCRRRPRP